MTSQQVSANSKKVPFVHVYVRTNRIRRNKYAQPMRVAHMTSNICTANESCSYDVKYNMIGYWLPLIVVDQ